MKRATALKVLAGTFVVLLLASAFPAAQMLRDAWSDADAGEATPPAAGADGGSRPVLPFDPLVEGPGAPGAGAGASRPTSPADGLFSPGLGKASSRSTGSALLDQVIGSAKLMGYDVEIPPLPVDQIPAANPLRAAILEWIAVTGSPVEPQTLAAELAKADALPLDLQRDLALLVLSAAKASLLQAQALALLTPEDVAWVHSHPELAADLAAGRDTPETRRLAALAALVDTPRSIQASLLLLQAVEATRGSLSQAAAARTLGDLSGADLDPSTRALLALLATSGGRVSDADKVRLAADLVAATSGLPVPASLPKVSFREALAALLAATQQPVDPEQLSVVLARADALPADLQAALAGPLLAQARAVEAANPANRGDPALALLGVLVATADALPALEKYAIYWREAPDALRVGQWTPTHRAGWVAEHAALFAGAGADPARLVQAGGALHGLGFVDARVPDRSFVDAYAALAAEAGHAASPEEMAQVKAAGDRLDPAVRDAAARMMSGAAEAARLRRAAFADLSPEEQRFLAVDAMRLDALYLKDGLTQDERSLLARAAELSRRVDGALLAQAGVVGARATMEARDILAGQGAFSAASADVTPVSRWAWLSKLLPFGTARAQVDAPCGGAGTLVEYGAMSIGGDCSQDILLRIALIGLPASDCDARTCTYSTEQNTELLVVTGTAGSGIGPQKVQRMVCDRVSFDSCVRTTVSAYGAPAVHLDLGGSDTYSRPVAMTFANATVPVSLHLDVGGSDTYLDPTSQYDGRSPLLRLIGRDMGHPTQGSGLFGGVALLVDATGDDTYIAPSRSQGFARYGVGLLVDLAGADRYRGGLLTQGAASDGFNLGVGILADAMGDDTRTAASGQGYGLGGVLLDFQGRDRYENGEAARGVPVVALELDLAGDLTALDERRDESAWTGGPGDLNLGIGLDQEATLVGSGDRDGDGWSDAQEIIAGSDPDDRGQGVPEGPEARARSLAKDSDGDLYPDFVERALSSDPQDPRSYPAGFPRGPTFHEPTGVYGDLTPGNEAPNPGLGEGSDKVLDLRLPLQDAGGLQNACTGNIRLNLSDGAPFVLEPQSFVVPPDAAPQNIQRRTLETPGAGYTQNEADTLEQEQAANLLGKGWSRGDRCVFVSYGTGSPGEGNVSQPYAGRPEEERSFRFRVPAGILAVGDVVRTRYEVDYFFVVDLGGNDVFNNSAGGALPVQTTTNPYSGPSGLGGTLNNTGSGSKGTYDHAFLAPSLVLNVDPVAAGGASTSRVASQDASADDLYLAPEGRADFAHGSLWGVLVDTAGRDTYRAGGGSQGSLGGVLLDLGGKDVYQALNLSQGASLAIAPTRDVAGYPMGGANPSRDASLRRAVPGILLDYGEDDDTFTASSHSQGFARGFADESSVACTDERCRGLTPLAYGILLSQGGRDTFDVRARKGVESQGVGTQLGVGILLDTAGDDDYLAAGPVSHGATVTQTQPRANGPPLAQVPGAGLLVDLGGADEYLVGTVHRDGRQNNLTLTRAPIGFGGERAGVLYGDPGVHLDAEGSEPGSVVNAVGGGRAALSPEGSAAGFLVDLPTARLAIGSETPTVYRGVDYAFIVDLGGANVYEANAGGLVHAVLGEARSPGPVANAERPTVSLYPVSLLFDAGQHASEYRGGRAFVQGAGFFSVGVLVDNGGEDRFTVAPDALPVLNNTWMRAPPTVDGTVDPSEWSSVPGRSLVFQSVNDSRVTSPFTVRVANDADNLYVAVTGRTAGVTPDERRADRFLLALDRGASRLASVPVPGDQGGARQSWLDGVVLGVDAAGCTVSDRHWLAVQDLHDSVAPRPDLKASCTVTEDGNVSYEIQKPLREAFPKDLGDLNLPYDPVVGWTEATRLGLHMEFIEKATGTIYAWPPATTVRDGELGFRADANLSDEMSAWAVTSLANLGEAQPLPVATRSPVFSQGAGLAGVGVLAMLGGHGSGAHLQAADRAQGYGGYGGLGVLLDAGGSDLYRAGDLAQGAAEAQGFGLLVDAEGNDRYESSARSLGYAEDQSGAGGALFLDLYGYDAYARRPPSFAVGGLTSADLSSSAATGNERVWTQGVGAGADYSLTSAARDAVAGTIEPRYFGAERVTLRVTKHVNGQCTDQPVEQYTVNVPSPKPIVEGLVCLKADVDLTRGDQADPFATGSEPLLTVDAVDFLLDGARLGAGNFTGEDRRNPGTRSTWVRVLDGAALGDGVRKVAALAVFRVEQKEHGAVLFYDDIDPQDDRNPAVRSVYINNAPEVRLGLSPPFNGVAGAAFSPLASAPALPHLRADYSVSRDAGEDRLAISQGWKAPPRFSNVPCDDADPTRLCNLLPLYFGSGPDWDTTPRGSAAERQMHRENSRGNTPFEQLSAPLMTPLEVTKKGSFHVVIPDHNTTLPRPGDYKTRIELRLRDANKADYKVDGKPVVLYDGVFVSRRDPIPVETVLNVFKDLRPVTDNVSAAIAGASRSLEGNPLEVLVAALLSPCTPGDAPSPIEDAPVYCDQFEGNPGATGVAHGRLCHPNNVLGSLRSVYSSLVCSPTLGDTLQKQAKDNENEALTNLSRDAAALLRDGAGSLTPTAGSNLNWTDFYFDVDPRGLQDNGDTVVIPAGTRLYLKISSETELFSDTGGEVTQAYGSLVDEYFALAGQVRDAGEERGVPTSVDLFGVKVDPLGMVGESLDAQRGDMADREKRVSSLTVLPFSFFTYQTGGEEQARMEIRTPAEATTLVEATIETPAGEKVMDLAPARGLQGDVPGSPTRDGNLTLEGNRTRWVPLAGGERFTQHNATFDGDDETGREIEDGLYRVRVAATDFSGREANATSAFLLDRTAPVTSLTTRSFAGSAYVENNAIPVTWQAVETGSGLSRVAVYGRAGGAPGAPGWTDVGPGAWTLLGIFPESVTSTTFTLASTDTYHFVSVGEDRVGNVERAVREADPFLAGFRGKLALGQVHTVVVDQTRPVLSVPEDAVVGARVVDYRGADVPFVKAGSPVTFRACAGDEGPRGIERVRIVLDQVNLTTNEVLSRNFTAALVGACPNGQALYQYDGWGALNADKALFPDGVWAASVEAFDAAGNRIQATLATLVLDSKAPKVKVHDPVYPVGQSAVKPGDVVSVRLLATDPFGVDDAGIRVDASALNRTGVLTTRAVRVDGILLQEATFRVDVPVDNLVYAVNVSVPDHAGNVAVDEVLIPVDGRTFTIDPSSVRVTNVTHNSVVLRWNTSENATSQARFGTTPVELRQRSTLVQNLTKEHALKVDGLAPSTRYFLRALSTSAGGYANESDPVEVVTATALFLEPLTPRAGAQLSGVVDLAFKGGLRDSTDFVTYSLEVQPRPDANWSFVTTLTRSGGEHAVSFNSSRYLDGGAYRLKVTAEAGKDRTSALFGPFMLDNTPPVVDVYSPLIATNDTTPFVEVDLRDNLAGLGTAPATLLIDGRQVEGGLVATPVPGGARVTYQVASALAPGVHAFELRARDKAGATTTETWKVSVDGDAPLVTANPLRFAPGERAARQGGTVTLNLTVQDASGVSVVTVDASGLSSAGSVRMSRVSGTDFFTATLPVSASEDGGARRVLVEAVDLAGNARRTSVDVPVDNVAPRVGEVRAGVAQHTAVDLAVAAGSEPVLLRGTATAPASPPVTASTTEFALAPTLAFRGLLPSRTYAYTLEAVDGAGNVAEVTGRFSTRDDVEKPGVAKGLEVTDLLNGTLRLTWAPAPDDVGVAFYRVYRSDDGVTFQRVAEVTETSFEDVGLPLETPFHYQVAAVDHGANEGQATERLKASATALPRLSVGVASPAVGTPSTLFRWTITYASPGGKEPQHVRVILDGVPQTMVRQPGGNAVDGLTYAYESRLAPHTRDEPHTYAFEASDGRYTVKFPEDGSLLRGPLVSGDASAAGEAGGFASFAQRVPLGGAAATAFALLLAVAVVALVVRRKQEGSK